MANQLEEQLTMKDVIRITKIPRSTLYKYIDDGIFPKPDTKINGHWNRWSEKQLKDFLESQKNQKQANK